MKVQGSIQRWITVGAVLVVAAIVGFGGLFVDQVLRQRIVKEAEGSLESVLRLGSSRMCAAARQADRDGSEFFEDRTLGSMDRFAWVVQGRGRASRDQAGPSMPELARTEGFPFDNVNAWLDPKAPARTREVEFFVGEGSNGERYRVATFVTRPASERPGGRPDDRGSMRPGPRRGDEAGRPPRGPERRPRGEPGGDRGRPPFRPGEQFRVFVAASIHEEAAVLSSLQGTLLLAGAFAVALAVLLVPLTVRRGLRPLRRISEGIGRVNEERLDQAFEFDGATVELLPIIQSFESVRQRLAAAFVREKRFTSDAAHELRTPLAGLRASMEVALRRERSSTHYRETITECLAITESMQGMVNSLLALAKGAEHELKKEPVHIADGLRRSFEAQADVISDRHLTLQWDGEAEPIILGNDALAERIFGNLASNAVNYADEDSVIRVVFESEEGTLRTRVINRASGVSAETAERAFEPLWRSDEARTDASLHAGLGLSLVQQCVEALGGTAEIEAGDGTFEICVTLPR